MNSIDPTPTDQDADRVSMVRVPTDLHWQAKAAAARERVFIGDWYERAIRRALEDSQPPP